MSKAVIHQLDIERFRGIRSLTWKPGQGLNIILGGGDVGKTTILDAIGLLLSPTFPSTVPDTDYFGRSIEEGFTIEAVVRLPPETGVSEQSKPAWPWIWTGTEAVVPTVDESEGSSSGEPVYKLRVRGTSDLELVYEVIQPNESADHCSVGLRRAIGLIRLAEEDRYGRDLRLVQGAALDRLLSDRALRSRLASELAKVEVVGALEEKAKESLEQLDEAFRLKGLPYDLSLAITGARGASVTALVGLTATQDSVALPLACWGAGTRRFAALAIAEQNQLASPITLVDEVERGLEPYRQRTLMARLRAGQAQTFMTTHSPAVISASAEADIWFVDHTGQIGPIDRRKIEPHLRNDPEAFLARLAIVAEGATECGFVTALLERALGSSLDGQGVHVIDAGGNEAALDLLDALRRGGLTFGGFVDNEGVFPDRWQAAADHLGALLFRWPEGCLDENVISCVADGQLEDLVNDPEGRKTGIRLRNLADRLEISQKDFAVIQSTAGSGLRELIVAAVLGKPTSDDSETKRYKSETARWFKSTAGGVELAEKVFQLGLWSVLKPRLMPFCNAVRDAVGLPAIEDLEP